MAARIARWPAKNDLVVFTWNVKGNEDAVKLACAHLNAYVALGAHCVGALQEPPSNAKTLIESCGLRVHSSAGKNTVFHSSGISEDSSGPAHRIGPSDDRGRIVGVTLQSPEWSGLRFLAVHAPDRLNNCLQEQRTVWGTQARSIRESMGDPAVVAGDFNANPWDSEMTWRQCWYASHPNRNATKPGKLPGESAHALPLVNTMWSVVSSKGTRGSFQYPDTFDLRWHFLDQILISPELYRKRMAPRVLHRMQGKALADARGPNMEWSDHLPVELVIPARTLALLPRTPESTESL